MSRIKLLLFSLIVLALLQTLWFFSFLGIPPLKQITLNREEIYTKFTTIYTRIYIYILFLSLLCVLLQKGNKFFVGTFMSSGKEICWLPIQISKGASPN